MEIVQAATDAYIAGDIDGMMEFYALSIEAFPDASFLESEPLYGHEQFRRWVEGIRAPWAVPRWVVHETRAIEPDRVLQRGDFGGMGRGSSIETLASYTLIFTIRNSQIARVDYFSEHTEALKAVGLRE
ncbi:MAG: nuclear transport factor 2 family protein [Actinobacteria bacterium]|nr:MAG: nuclear transport factor 2 family protein [Actinomycetota bacterium]